MSLRVSHYFIHTSLLIGLGDELLVWLMFLMH